MKKQMTKARFIEWYFSDLDDVKNIGWEVIEALKRDGKFEIDTQFLFDNCGTIPLDGEEVETDNIELI
jgi:hypothetical protein